jgi:hypothetical protein
MDLCSIDSPVGGQNVIYVATETYIGQVFEGNATHAAGINVIAQGRVPSGVIREGVYASHCRIGQSITNTLTFN